MELSYEELEALISDISTGKKYILLEGTVEFINVEFPNNDIRQRAELVYKQTYNKAITDGLLPVKEFETLLQNKGVLTTEDEEKLQMLKNKLKAQEVLLSKTLKVKANQDRIKKVISSLEEEIRAILYKKTTMLAMSADAKAEEAKTLYMCWECTKDASGSLYWPNYEMFVNDSDNVFTQTVINKFSELVAGIDTPTIRFIARSSLWRLRYTTSIKTSEPLFGIPTSDYTTDQLNLLYWSNFYENVYNMLPESRPTDDVIEDDALLDKYMEEYYKELNNEAAIARSNKAKSRGAMSAFDAEEVIVTQSHELYQDIQYDKPREAQRVKDRVDIKKRTVSSR